MKSKSKKTDKKKVLSTKKDETKEPIQATPAPLTPKAQVEAAPALTSEPTHIEVITETMATTTPVIEERRVISSDERRRLISLAAYYRAQRTGFGKTNPIEDWLLAEREIDAMIAGGNAI